MVKTILLTITLTFLTVPALAQEPTPTPTPNIVIADRIGINNPTPEVPVHIKVNYPAGGTYVQDIVRIDTPTEGSDPFEIIQRTTHFGGDNVTDSISWGWGHKGSLSGFGLNFLMEHKFGNNAEVHIQTVSPGRTAAGHSYDRPWTWTFDRTTGEAGSFTSAARINLKAGFLADLVNDVNGLYISNLSIGAKVPNGNFGIHGNSIVFQTWANQGNPAKTLRILPLPSDSEQSALAFGNAWLSSIYPDGIQAWDHTGNIPGDVYGSSFRSQGASGFTSKIVIGDNITVNDGSSIKFGGDITIVKTGPRALAFRDANGNVPVSISGAYNVNANAGEAYKANGVSGVTMSGSKCVITQIVAGIIVGAKCVP